MLTNPTINQMLGLGLTGMAAAWRDLAAQPGSDELGRNEWLGLMVDREVTRHLSAPAIGGMLFPVNQPRSIKSGVSAHFHPAEKYGGENLAKETQWLRLTRA